MTVEPLPPSDHPALRRLMVDRLRHDLLGPRARDETLSQRPEDEYLLGALFPGSSSLTDEDVEEAVAGAADVGEDQAGGATAGLKQSSIGLTVVLPPDADAPLSIEAAYGTYDRLVDGVVDAGKSKSSS